MLDILNKVLVNQLDPNVVIAKLDEIITTQKKEVAAIDEIQQQSWRKLTDDEIAHAISILQPFSGTKVHIIVTNPDPDRLAAQVLTHLRDHGRQEARVRRR